MSVVQKSVILFQYCRVGRSLQRGRHLAGEHSALVGLCWLLESCLELDLHVVRCQCVLQRAHDACVADEHIQVVCAFYVSCASLHIVDAAQVKLYAADLHAPCSFCRAPMSERGGSCFTVAANPLYPWNSDSISWKRAFPWYDLSLDTSSPTLLAVVCARAKEREVITTFAPCSTSDFAVYSPMPDVPPVISTVFPATFRRWRDGLEPNIEACVF